MDHCQIPPVGWYCTRGYGHDGPCAARTEQELEAYEMELLEKEFVNVMSRMRTPRGIKAARALFSEPLFPKGFSGF